MSGNSVLTEATLGTFIVTEQQTTYISYGPTSSAFTELIGAHSNPAPEDSRTWAAARATATRPGRTSTTATARRAA